MGTSQRNPADCVPSSLTRCLESCGFLHLGITLLTSDECRPDIIFFHCLAPDFSIWILGYPMANCHRTVMPA